MLLFHWRFQAAALVLCFTASSLAMPPSEIMKDLERPQITNINKSLATMPSALKDSLRRLFEQRVLSIADVGRPFRETDVITDAGTAKLPARRLTLAFATPRFYYVYYRSGGYGTAGNLLVFGRKDAAYKFIWGGVEFENEPTSPDEIIKRVRRKSFDDSKHFAW